MPEGQRGRPGQQGGVKGHFIKVEAYEKFVPEDYKDRKKGRR